MIRPVMVMLLLLAVIHGSTADARGGACPRLPGTGTSLTGHLHIEQVLVSEADSKPIVVSVGSEGTVRVWDAMTLRPLGRPVPGRAPIALISVAGRPVLAAASGFRQAQAWDLRSRTRLWRPITLGVVGDLDGIPVAAEGHATDGRLFDMRTGVRHGGTAAPPGKPLAIIQVGGVPALVTLTSLGNPAVWNLRTGRPLLKELQLYREDDTGVRGLNDAAIELTDLQGRPTLLMPTYDRGVVAWDLVTGAWHTAMDIEETNRGDNSTIATHRGTNVFARVEERPGPNDDLDGDGFADRSRLTVWDPAGGEQLASIDIPGHVTSLAAHGSMVVTGGTDGALRCIDLDTGQMLVVIHGSPVSRLNHWVMAGDAAVSPHPDGGWQMFDSVTQEPIGSPVGDAAAVRSIAATEKIVVTGGGRFDPVVRTWDPRTRQETGPPLTTEFPLGVDTVVVQGDLLVAMDSAAPRSDAPQPITLRVWSLRSRQLVFPPLRLPSARNRELGLLTLEGRPVAVVLGDSMIRVVDLSSGRTVRTIAIRSEMNAGETRGWVTGLLKGRPFAAFAQYDTIFFKDLITGGDLMPPLKSSFGPIKHLTLRGHVLLVFADVLMDRFDLTARTRLPLTES